MVAVGQNKCKTAVGMDNRLPKGARFSEMLLRVREPTAQADVVTVRS